MRRPARRRLATIARLRGLLRSSRDRLDRRLRDLLAERSGAGFSHQPTLDHLDDELAAAERRLGQAEEAYDRAQLRPARLRRRRDRLAGELYDCQDSARRLLAGVLGRRHGAAIVTAAPKAALLLVRHVRLLTSLLPGVEPEAPELAGVELDPAALAGQLEGLADRLEGVCAALEESGADVVTCRSDADSALAEADRVVSWVARSLEGLYLLAGLDDLAERIRAAARR